MRRTRRMLSSSPSLLLLVWCALVAAAAGALSSQVPLQDSIDDDQMQMHTTSTNIVDLVAADPDLSLFVRLLQRARLIPTLNKLHDGTLFAPVNDAIRNRSLVDTELMAWISDGDGYGFQDNLQYRLRERLFYHLLNYTSPDLSFPDAQDSRVSYESTLLFPTRHEEHGRPGHVPYPEPEDTLLGGEGQKLAFVREEGRIGVDANGNGGHKILSNRGGVGRNGKVVVIDGLLEAPRSIAHQIQDRAGEDSDEDGLSRFASLMDEEMWKSLREISHTTLFVPQNKAFNVLPQLEWQYLKSGFAKDDILEITANHQTEYRGDAARREKVGYLNRLLDVQTIPVASGQSVKVVKTEEDDSKITVNGSNLVSGNILASNGVMHIIEDLLLPLGSLVLTPEKYLLALNATKFVSLFRDNNLSHLLQSSPRNTDNNASYTILAAKDDILERMEALPWMTLPPKGSRELKETLQYHVIQGKHTQDQLRDGSLLKTMLSTSSLSGQQQRMAVSVSSDEDDTPGKAASAKDKGDLAFGDANVIAEPIEVGNSIIYLISRIIEPPSSFVSTALDRGLSTFVASVYSSTLDKKLLHQSPATTFLAPTNSAFERLGLALKYLLLPAAKTELGQVLSYHALKGTVYLDEVESDSEHFETLEGSDIYLERSKTSPSALLKHKEHREYRDPGVQVRGPRYGGAPVNGDVRSAKIREGDLLTSTGVLHVIDQVELPPTLNITSEKLMRGARASTFPDLLRQVNMSFVAQGKPAPGEFFQTSPLFTSVKQKDLAKVKEKFASREAYTILCPTDKAFSRINLTRYLNDLPSLLALVELHIIPLASDTVASYDGRPLALADDTSFSTLYSKNEGGPSKYGQLVFRKHGGSDWMVGIKGARGTNGKHDNARILTHGRNTPIFSEMGPNVVDGDLKEGEKRLIFGGGVLLLDGVLEPFEPTWWQTWGWIAFIAVLAMFLVSCMALLGWKAYGRWREKHWYDELPQGPEDPE